MADQAIAEPGKKRHRGELPNREVSDRLCQFCGTRRSSPAVCKKVNLVRDGVHSEAVVPRCRKCHLINQLSNAFPLVGFLAGGAAAAISVGGFLWIVGNPVPISYEILFVYVIALPLFGAYAGQFPAALFCRSLGVTPECSFTGLSPLRELLEDGWSVSENADTDIRKVAIRKFRRTSSTEEFSDVFSHLCQAEKDGVLVPQLWLLCESATIGESLLTERPHGTEEFINGRPELVEYSDGQAAVMFRLESGHHVQPLIEILLTRSCGDEPPSVICGVATYVPKEHGRRILERFGSKEAVTIGRVMLW